METPADLDEYGYGTAADINGDGLAELILRIDYAGRTRIFYREDDKIRVYSMAYRSMEIIYDNGLILASNSGTEAELYSLKKTGEGLGFAESVKCWSTILLDGMYGRMKEIPYNELLTK